MSEPPVPDAPLVSAQFILACLTMGIVGSTVAAVVLHGDDGNIKLVLGFVFGLGSAVSGFYFGSSQSSQKKDAVIAQQTSIPPGATTTTTTTPPRTTTVVSPEPVITPGRNPPG